MKPRPSPDPAARFGPALTLAATGRFADAVVQGIDLSKSEAGTDAEGHPIPDDARATAGAQALARIARLAEAGQDLESADRALEHARRLRPTYADLHFHHGALLARRGKRREARKALEAALKKHPLYLAARVELAMLDAREGRIGEALAALREIQRDDKIEEPRAFQQGLRSLELADWEGADAFMRRAVRGADPRLEQTLEQFRRLMAEGQAERAADVLRGAVEEHETYPDLHVLLGTAELALGHYDDAVASIARGLELNPDYHAARVQLALAFDALGDRGAATEQLHLVLQADPDHAPARELLEVWTPKKRAAGQTAPGGDSARRKDP